MRIIIFHYHLQPGGVTSVISLSTAAIAPRLTENDEIVLVSGRETDSARITGAIEKEALSPIGCSIRIEVIKETGYLSEDEVSEISCDRLKEELLRRFGGDLWWIHNYHIGKNPLFTRAVIEIARERDDQPIFLQIHDFPECARYSNLSFLDSYIRDSLYPRNRLVRYGVINSRDRDLLRRAGLTENEVHLLPNPARIDETVNPVEIENAGNTLRSLFEKSSGYLPGKPFFLYPVRAIRRKNVLEAGLISRLFSEPVNLLTTLPGTSDSESSYSDLVKNCYRKGYINGLFGKEVQSALQKVNISFIDFIRASRGILSSSIQEGFGYLYLQAIQTSKPLVAREIDTNGDIASLFSEEIHFQYRTLLVPVSDTEKHDVLEEYRTFIASLTPFIGTEKAGGIINRIEGMLSDSVVDFSYLSPGKQYSLLERHSDNGFIDELRNLNPALIDDLEKIFTGGGEQAPGSRAEEYGLETFAHHFFDILESYKENQRAAGDTSQSSPDHYIRDYFARPEYMRLLYAPYPP